LDWNRTIPGNSHESAKTATDGEFLYVIGTGNTTGSNSSAMLMKYDGDGNELWNRSWGGLEQDIPLDVMVDGGVVYVVGNMGDGIYPDPLFLIAYNSSGAELWNRTWGGAAMDWAQGMVAVNGTLYITGWTTSFGAGGVDAFVVGFNLSNRTFGPHWTWGDWGDDFGYGITYMNGSLYVCIFASNSPGNAGIVKFDMDGNELWNETWGLGGHASSIATDGSSVFVAGSMRDGGSHAAFLRAYSGGRQLLMEKKYGEPAYDDIFWGIRVQYGVAYCIGSTKSYSGDHSWNACLLGYDTVNGTETMNITFGGPDEDQGSGILVDNDSSVYCSGGSFDNSSGRWEMFLAKYSNMPKMAGMPVRFDVGDPSGLPYHYLEAMTGSGGEGADSLLLPEDAPEGLYNCSISINDSGVIRFANATFEVRWPWSGVLELASSFEARSYLPGETVRVSVYAGYEYPPVLGKKPAPGMELRFDLLDTNMTTVAGLAERTNDTGWAGFVFDIPANASEGIHTVQVGGFEGLNRTVRFDVMLPVRQAAANGSAPVDLPVVPIAGTAVIGIIAIAVAIGATETGKFSLFVPFVPLYTRIRRDKALSHRVRHLIIGYLVDNPGQHYNGLKKALKLSNSVMVYHLNVLEREGFIKSQRDGTMKRFYPISVKTPETRKRTPKEIDSDILGTIEKRPGMTQKELVKHLVLSNDIVKNHLRKLLRDDQIVARKKGKTRVFFLSGND
jgi:DNA-binding MarR family transcriptional regulator